MKHKLFTTLLVMLMSMAVNNAFAQDYDVSANNEDGATIYYKYINNGTELEVVNCYDDATDLHIPSQVQVDKGYEWEYIPVTSIGNSALLNCHFLSSVYFPSSINKIGSNAFNSLDKIVIEDLSSWCSVDIDGPLASFFSYSLYIDDTEITELVIPTDVTTISPYTFSGCKSITSVEIPSNVESIGEGAFQDCKNLSSLNCDYGVETIGNYAFQGCEALTSADFYVKNLGAYSFAQSGLESYVVNNGTMSIGSIDWGLWNSRERIAYTPFPQCKNLKTVSVSPSNTKYDSRDGFNGIIETSSGKLIFATPTKYIKLPEGVKSIAMLAFAGGAGIEKIDSVDLGEEVEALAPFAFFQLDIGKLKYPSTITDANEAIDMCNIDTLELVDLKAWCEHSNSVIRNAEGARHLVVNGKVITDLVIPSGTTKICDFTFYKINGFSSVLIPNCVTEIGKNAFNGSSDLKSIKVEWDDPLLLTESICYNASNVTLYVPRGCKAAYEAADYWKNFKEIKEYGDGNATIAMGSSGIMTYSNSSDMNFTDVSGLKAYIASGYNPATGDLTMTRVYKVPAGEGLILKGAADSYEVPYEETSAYYANLLVGVPTATTVSPTDGSYTNFILANDEVKGIGFYPLASAGEMGPNKAYLQLPTSILPAASRSLRMVFDDEEDVTGIKDLNEKGAMSARPKDACYQGDARNENFFDLQGRRVVKPTRGLYIKDGKKIMVK